MSIDPKYNHGLEVVTPAWVERKEWINIYCCVCETSLGDTPHVVGGTVTPADVEKVAAKWEGRLCPSCENTHNMDPNDGDYYSFTRKVWERAHAAKHRCTTCDGESYSEGAADLPCLGKIEAALTQLAASEVLVRRLRGLLNNLRGDIQTSPRGWGRERLDDMVRLIDEEGA